MIERISLKDYNRGVERVNIERAKAVTKSLGNGFEVVVRKIEIPRPRPGSVAIHEARHVVASSGIKSATIVPNGDALGTTTPDKLTPASAAAPAAFGDSGTGWDKYITEYYLGVDWKTAQSAAKAVLSGQDELVHEVATTLEEEGTIGQSHVDRAKEKVTKEKKGIFPLKIDIYKSGQLKETISLESSHGEVEIPQFSGERSNLQP